MKFIIKESKYEKYIYKYIDNTLKQEKITTEHPFKEEADHYNYITSFYSQDYYNGLIDDVLFEHATKKYYEYYEDEERIEASPILLIYNSKPFRGFKNLFGNDYRPQFEKWFTETYPEYPVKTFVYNSSSI